MEKQDLQAGESQLQNSQFSNQLDSREQNTPRYESRKMVLNQAQD